ncbi:hypothetical protein FQN60_005753 [Etheostoma spectabile]|uniref:Uncharacterized protein n=1 Tax=Etheostoma spectabile TaxID=54343 RepID=A0A5J5CF54_9PERO|nr:hypothetical protein FQN60_005753 [Etheostoma spectabile]
MFQQSKGERPTRKELKDDYMFQKKAFWKWRVSAKTCQKGHQNSGIRESNCQCKCFSLRTSTMTKPSLTKPRPTSSLVSPNCIVTCGQVTPEYSTFIRHWLFWMSRTIQSTTSARASS